MTDTNKSTGGLVGGDSRLKTSAPNARGGREDADKERTQKDGTALTLEERKRMLRSEWLQEVLPTPPKMPGWHLCWLSTTNNADPIYKRVQMGYEPVKASELPGFAQYTVTQGEFEGAISCNEMVLFKIHEELYQDIMLHRHYEMPLGEEELLRANVNDRLDEEDSDGRKLGQVEGFDSLAKKVRNPTFA